LAELGKVGPAAYVASGTSPASQRLSWAAGKQFLTAAIRNSCLCPILPNTDSEPAFPSQCSAKQIKSRSQTKLKRGFRLIATRIGHFDLSSSNRLKPGLLLEIGGTHAALLLKSDDSICCSSYQVVVLLPIVFNAHPLTERCASSKFWIICTQRHFRLGRNLFNALTSRVKFMPELKVLNVSSIVSHVILCVLSCVLSLDCQTSHHLFSSTRTSHAVPLA
jgi:hypothetical protein